MSALPLIELAASISTGFFTPAQFSFVLTQHQPDNRYIRDINIYEVLLWVNLMTHALLAIWFYRMSKNKAQTAPHMMVAKLAKIFIWWFVYHSLQMIPMHIVGQSRLMKLLARPSDFKGFMEAISMGVACAVIFTYCTRSRTHKYIHLIGPTFVAGVCMYGFTRFYDYVW